MFGWNMVLIPIKQNLLSLLLTGCYFLPSPTPGMMVIFFIRCFQQCHKSKKKKTKDPQLHCEVKPGFSLASWEEVKAGCREHWQKVQETPWLWGLQYKIPIAGPQGTRPLQHAGPPEALLTGITSEVTSGWGWWSRFVKRENWRKPCWTFWNCYWNLLHLITPSSGPEEYLGEPMIFTNEYFQSHYTCQLCAKFLAGMTGNLNKH